MSRLSRITLVACTLTAAACGRRAATGRSLADAVRDARFAPACRRFVADEWPASLPVPATDANGRLFEIFFYPLSGAPGAPPRLAEPAAQAELDVDRGAPIVCRLVPGVPHQVAGPRWTAEASALSADAFDAKVVEFDRLAEEAAAAYAARRPPTAVDADAARRYLEAFEILAEPPYLADYYRLNPEFWEWVRAAAGRSIPPPDKGGRR